MVVTEEWYEAWRAVLAASLYAPSSVCQVAHVASETSRDWNVVVVAGSGSGIANVRYHPTLNLSFAMLSPVSSAAADP